MRPQQSDKDSYLQINNTSTTDEDCQKPFILYTALWYFGKLKQKDKKGDPWNTDIQKSRIETEQNK